MNDQTCGYCTRKQELLDGFGIYVCDLESSVLVLFKEQSHPGRCIVAYKEHAGDMTELADAERNAFFADVNRVAKALHAAFHPDKINYGAYGDTGCHLHMHLCPKYEGGDEWGGTFQMNPGKVYLTEAEYEEMIRKIRENL